MSVTRLLGRTTIVLSLAVPLAHAQEIDDEPTPADTVTEGDAAEPSTESADSCEDFGTGHSLIAGTETCLRVGGYVRFDSGAGELNGLDLDDDEDGDAETWAENTRFAFNTYTSTDTALGTLSTFTEVRFNYGNSIEELDPVDVAQIEQTSGSETTLNFAWIELGGLRLGKGETLFDTFTDYGGAVINDATIGGYGPFDTNFVSYTGELGGLSAAVSLEQGADDWVIDTYAPHVVLGLGYRTGPVNLRGALALDLRDDAVDDEGEDFGGGAFKVRADYTFSEDNLVFLMALYGENGSGYTTWDTGGTDEDTASVIGGHTVMINESLSSNSQLQWAEGNGDADDAYSVALNLAYDVVAGLTVTPEVQYLRDTEGDSAFGGVLRAQYSF